MIVRVLCERGEYPVDLTNGVTVQDLPKLIEEWGGIVVPLQGDDADRLFIPAAQIQAIKWQTEDPVVTEVGPEDLADVSFIGEEEPSTDKVGENGEIFIDS